MNNLLGRGQMRVIGKITCCGLLWLSGFTMTAFAAQSDVIIFDANESPPYWSERKVGQGVGGEIVAAISQHAGLQTVLHFKPLKRLIDDSTNNDLGNPTFFMRNQEFSAIIPIAVYHISLFYYQPNHAETVSVHNLQDLAGYKIGILKETLVDSDFFNKAGIMFENSYVQDSLFRKLKLGRIDFALRIELAADQSIKKLFPEETNNFKVVEEFKMTQPIAMMIAEDYPNGESIGEQLQSGLKAIIENGQYRDILHRYYGDDIPADWFKELAKFQRLYDF